MSQGSALRLNTYCVYTKPVGEIASVYGELFPGFTELAVEEVVRSYIKLEEKVLRFLKSSYLN